MSPNQSISIFSGCTGKFASKQQHNAKGTEDYNRVLDSARARHRKASDKLGPGKACPSRAAAETKTNTVKARSSKAIGQPAAAAANQNLRDEFQQLKGDMSALRAKISKL